MARKKKRFVVKDRAKTSLRLALTALIVIAIVGALVSIVFAYKSCNVILTARTVPLASSELSCGTGDGILYVRNGMLNFFSYKDEDANFSKFLSVSPTGIVGTSGVKAVWSDTAIQIIDAPFDIQPKGYVRAVRAGSSHIAVCMRKNDGSDLLTVYSSSGQEVYELAFAEGRLTGFGFSDSNGQTLWTMELTVESGSPRTTVTTFDLSRMSATGVITVTDQLVEDVFFTSSSVFVVGTETLIRYSAAANREIYRVQLHGYRVADRTVTGESVRLLLLPRNGGELTVARVLTVAQGDVASESAYTVTLEGAGYCCLYGGSLVIVGDTEVRIVDRSGETDDVLALPVGSTLSSKKLDERHILIERSGEFDLLTIGK